MGLKYNTKPFFNKEKYQILRKNVCEPLRLPIIFKMKSEPCVQSME